MVDDGGQTRSGRRLEGAMPTSHASVSKSASISSHAAPEHRQSDGELCRCGSGANAVKITCQRTADYKLAAQYMLSSLLVELRRKYDRLKENDILLPPIHRSFEETDDCSTPNARELRHRKIQARRQRK